MQLASALKTEVARPLKILVPMIKDELEAGDNAGIEHYRRAGEMLLEAKEQVGHGEFKSWVERNFTIKLRQAQRYMALVEHIEKRPASRFSSLGDFIRRTGPDPNYNTFASRKPPWQEPVQQIAARVNVASLTKERQDRERENEMLHKLGHQLIDIGYKVLAAKLHPDKGGSSEAMSRLNKVRNILKESI